MERDWDAFLRAVQAAFRLVDASFGTEEGGTTRRRSGRDDSQG